MNVRVNLAALAPACTQDEEFHVFLGNPPHPAIGQDSFLPCILAKVPFTMGQSLQAGELPPWDFCPSDIPRPETAHGTATVSHGSELVLLRGSQPRGCFCVCAKKGSN